MLINTHKIITLSLRLVEWIIIKTKIQQIKHQTKLRGIALGKNVKKVNSDVGFMKEVIDHYIMFQLFSFFFPSLWKCSLRYHQPTSHYPWRMTSFWRSSVRRASLVQMTVRIVSSGLMVRVKVTVTLDNAAASSVDLCASYSLAFRECLQMSSLTVLVKLVVCTSSSLEPQSFPASVVSWGQGVFSCTVGRTAEHALVFVGLSHMGSGVCGPVSHGLWGLWACLTWALVFVGLSHMGNQLVCVTDQGNTGGHAVTSL